MGGRNPEDSHTLARRRYDRLAPLYDRLERLAEPGASRWRRSLWRGVEGGDVLEIGVGTGLSIPYYPAGARVTGIDISAQMLSRARRRACEQRSNVRLIVGDAQALPFRSRSFDFAVATFVFASVADPMRALREVRRVMRRGGRLMLIESVLSQNRALRALTKAAAPALCQLFGAHLDRDTVAAVRLAGFARLTEASLFLDLVKRIEGIAP
jgi:ubiquinone/menaquinone biosynthesis C-methylase UbiE